MRSVIILLLGGKVMISYNSFFCQMSDAFQNTIISSIATVVGAVIGAFLTWLFGIRKKKKIHISLSEIETNNYKNGTIKKDIIIDLIIFNPSLYGKSIYELSICFKGKFGKVLLTKPILNLESFKDLSTVLVYKKLELLNLSPEQSALFKGRIELTDCDVETARKCKNIDIVFKNENGKVKRIKEKEYLEKFKQCLQLKKE